MSILIAIVLAQQGVVQTFDGYPTATTVEGATQQIPLGPVASQIAIKQLGTNGGGFLGQNSAHPFENPTPLTNFLEIFVIFWIGSALIYMFGVMAGDRRQGWAILGGDVCSFPRRLRDLVVGRAAAKSSAWSGESFARRQGSPLRPIQLRALRHRHDRRFVRRGQLDARLASRRSAVSCRCSTCSSAKSSSAASAPGLYGMLVFVVLAVFIAGLMVGRTPEYLGKKIEAYDVKMGRARGAAPVRDRFLCGSAWATVSRWGSAGLNNSGPHGLSEMLYAFSSAAGKQRQRLRRTHRQHALV